MATSKNMQTLRVGSYGGLSRSLPSRDSRAHTGKTPLPSAYGKQDTYLSPSGKMGTRSSPAASANFSLTEGDFPVLGNKCTTADGSSANSKAPKHPGSFSRVQTEVLPFTSPPKPWDKGARSILDAAAADYLFYRSSSRERCKVLPRRGQANVGHPESHIHFLGKLLTSILRHTAPHLKLRMRDDGYVMVNNLLKLEITTRAGVPLNSYTVNDMEKAVKLDNKQRLSLLTENGTLWIRASQGHSIKDVNSDMLLKPILSSDAIPVCVHGTRMANLTLILKFGLKKMGRNHVHFAPGLPSDSGVLSGMRHTSEVLIYLDAKKAIQDGMKLFRSDNRVILTEGFDGVVPPQYFASVVQLKNGKFCPLGRDRQAKQNKAQLAG